MASALPPLSGWEAVRAFERTGWFVARRRGSHFVLKKSDARHNLAIPDHPELKKGTLLSLIRKAGLTVGEFRELLS